MIFYHIQSPFFYSLHINVKNYEGCEILTSLRANKLPCYSLIDWHMSRDLSQRLLLLIKAVLLKTQWAALAVPIGSSCPTQWRWWRGWWEGRPWWMITHTVGLYYNWVIANFEISSSHKKTENLPVQTLKQRDILTVLSYS